MTAQIRARRSVAAVVRMHTVLQNNQQRRRERLAAETTDFFAPTIDALIGGVLEGTAPPDAMVRVINVMTGEFVGIDMAGDDGHWLVLADVAARTELVAIAAHEDGRQKFSAVFKVRP